MLRRKLGIPGEQGQLCHAIHAEQNAIIQAARMGSRCGATLYCSHQPCAICARLINAGIACIVYDRPYPDAFSRQILDESGILRSSIPSPAMSRHKRSF